MQGLDELLARADMSKYGLARRLGIDPATVSRWHGNPPKYARAYLELYVKVKELWESIG